MIHKLGQVMLYVKNQDAAKTFWTGKMGFHLIAEESTDYGMRWIEVAPTEDAETSIVLHDKDFIAKMSPEVNLGTPSLMFFTKDIHQFHDELSNKGVKVGEIVNMPGGNVFNFTDIEENYFAVMEK